MEIGLVRDDGVLKGPLGKVSIKRLVKIVIHEVNAKKFSEMAVRLVSDKTMRELNRLGRGLDRTTDVLSYAAQDGAPILTQGYLGDVVISVDQVARQAKRLGQPVDREFAKVLIHGVLHCLGFDHVRSRKGAREMKRMERLVLRKAKGAGLCS